MSSSAGGRDNRDSTDASGFQKRLATLEGRLGEARAKQAGPPPSSRRGTALGLAFRIGVELIAGVVVGGLIGWQLDSWLGTSPVLLLVFFLLGAAAGILTVMRTARAMQEGSGAGTGRDLPVRDDD